MQGKALFHLILMVMLGVISMTTNSETWQPLLTKNDIGQLESRGDLISGKISLLQTSDAQRIENTGVVIVTQEPGYMVIEGDHHRIEQIRAMGFSLHVPVEADYIKRLFRVWVLNKEEFIRLRAITSGVFPEHWPTNTKFPLYVGVFAYDCDFKWAKEAGFNIERCHNDNCY